MEKKRERLGIAENTLLGKSTYRPFPFLAPVIVSTAHITVHLQRFLNSYRVYGVNSAVSGAIIKNVLTVQRQEILVNKMGLHQQRKC